MLWAYETFREHTLHGTDGAIGAVHDLLFDDQSWAVRYLVVDTSEWLFGRKVLIAVSALGEPDPRQKEFAVPLTRERIRNNPEIDTDQPVSRQMEDDLHGYYGWMPYWGTAVPADPDPRSEEGPPNRMAETDAPHLRSVHEVEGYHVGAADGAIGHVEHVLIDPEDWRIRYFVVETGDWLLAQMVLVAPEWVRGIDWDERTIDFDLTREQVRESPPYNPNRSVERGYEERLWGYYRRSPYWV